MHPGIVAKQTPDKTAYVMAGSGLRVTYGQLEEAANRGAQLFRKTGLQRGDHIAILLENHPKFLQICWAAQRAGLYYTTLSWRLKPDEIEYIVNDCDAKIFVTSKQQEEMVASLHGKMPNVIRSFMVDGVSPGFEAWEECMVACSDTMIPDPAEGQSMLYSSGTTGNPKGIVRPLSEAPYGSPVRNVLTELYGVNANTVYLSPAPLYHSAPLGYCMGVLREGGEVIIMEHFEPLEALELIERHNVTHSQWVPTMFIRLLKLSTEQREQYDLSSQNFVIHAAAPCPVPVKRQMIEWWGPVIYEYYSGTEANGHIRITSEEWLAHPGSVGRPINCELHICDEVGQELPPGEQGMIFMAGGPRFEYYKDPEKTASVYDDRGWSTLGDVGYLDREGFLYLTDRKHFMIISGGVNIYPQESENVLIVHPKVADVAVFGVPHPDFGEEVKAVVQPQDMADAGPALAEELLKYCRSRLSNIKCPRSIDFRAELPRHPTGKLYKRLLRDEYLKRSKTD